MTPVHPTLFTHIKFLKLCKALKFKYESPPVPALGHLSFLWRHVYTGRVEIIQSKEDIEIMADWDGEPGVFAHILIDVGFIDALDDGTFQVHGYCDNFPDAYKDDFVEIIIQHPGVNRS